MLPGGNVELLSELLISKRSKEVKDFIIFLPSSLPSVFSFLVVVGFELRDLQLLDKRSTT
jgi:hypothetical protein